MSKKKYDKEFLLTLLKYTKVYHNYRFYCFSTINSKPMHNDSIVSISRQRRISALETIKRNKKCGYFKASPLTFLEICLSKPFDMFQTKERFHFWVNLYRRKRYFATIFERKK